MILTCEKCQRRYSVADDLLRRKTVKLRCKNCQHIIIAPPPSDISPRSGDGPALGNAQGPWDATGGLTGSAKATTPWFAMIKGKQAGPLQLPDLQNLIHAGDLTARTHVWRQGMPDWKRAIDAPQVAGLLPVARTEAASKDSLAEKADLFTEADHSPLQVKGRPLPGLKLSAKLQSNPAFTITAPENVIEQKSAAPYSSGSPTLGDPATAGPGEATRFFIAEAGMNERNPPWKIAAFAIALAAVPIGVLYLLSALKVGPLVVTRVDASGNEVKQSVLSAEGVSGLGDLLLGRQRSLSRSNAKASPAVRASNPRPPTPGPMPQAPERSTQAEPASPELRAFYGDNSHQDIRPRGLQPAGSSIDTDTGVSSLAEAEVAKVVAQTQPAFQFCIEQEMKKNPAFRGGKVFISATVGSSGTVKKAAIDRPDIESSGLGECLKAKARRMTFPAFSGEETELQIPLILTTAL